MTGTFIYFPSASDSVDAGRAGDRNDLFRGSPAGGSDFADQFI